MKKRHLKFTRWLAAGLVAVMFALMTVNIGDVRAAAQDGQWVQDAVGWWYQYENGRYPRDGIFIINGKSYAFDENGYMRTGWILGKQGWYYADDSGAFVTGWRQINGKWYWFDRLGCMATNQFVGSGKYYVNANGEWADKSEHGQWVLDSVGWWYRYADGSYPKNKMLQIENDYYRFDENGYMITGWWQQSGNTWWFYYDDTGRAAEGWRQINNIWYYFYRGRMYMKQWIGGEYYVDENGAWQPSVTSRVNGQNMSGETGQWIQNAVGWWYQYADGTYPMDGQYTINNKCYYFDANGYMQTGWVNEISTRAWYYYDASGAQVHGWQQINGIWYYFHANGLMASKEYIGDYYVDASGAWVPQAAHANY